MGAKLNMEEQFNLAAREYDSGRRLFIPCFDEYYEKTTAFAASFIGKPQRIVDLGSGTGLLAMYYCRHLPEAEYVLVDVAGEMLEVAGKRFAGMNNIRFQIMDYTRGLPEGRFDLVISALSIHHLEDELKAELFCNIKQKLPRGCWFINYDQFCCESPAMDKYVNEYWISGLYSGGLSATELERWQERRKLDRECSVADELAMLKNSGFANAECIYRCGKFAVIAAQA